MNADLMQSLARAVDAVEPLVASVGSADHNRATPCRDFNLAQLVAHLIGGLRGFADVAEGQPLGFDGDPDVSSEPASDAYRKAADRMIAAFERPGVLEQSFAMPWGDTDGTQLVGFELIELIVHGWDISRSVGQPASLPSDLVEAALFGAQQWVDDSTRTPQLFGAEVPVSVDAPALDRLVGFLGRNPDWTPESPNQ